MLFSRRVNCGRTDGRIEMTLGKNFRRPQIFSRNFGAQSGPTLQIFVVPGSPGPCQGPGPEASASPASWMIRPWSWQDHPRDTKRCSQNDNSRQLVNLVSVCFYCKVTNTIVVHKIRKFCIKFGHLIVRKIIKFVSTRCQLLRLKCTKIDSPDSSSWI